MDEQEIGHAPPGWKTEEQIMHHLMMLRLKDRLLRDLKAETDTNMALRKALLGLIFLSDTAEIAQELAQELLAEFRPLIDGFQSSAQGEIHPLTKERQCVRWRDPQGKFELLLQEEFYLQLADEVNEQLSRFDQRSAEGDVEPDDQ